LGFGFGFGSALLALRNEGWTNLVTIMTLPQRQRRLLGFWLVDGSLCGPCPWRKWWASGRHSISGVEAFPTGTCGIRNLLWSAAITSGRISTSKLDGSGQPHKTRANRKKNHLYSASCLLVNYCRKSPDMWNFHPLGLWYLVVHWSHRLPRMIETYTYVTIFPDSPRFSILKYSPITVLECLSNLESPGKLLLMLSYLVCYCLVVIAFHGYSCCFWK